MLQSWYKKRHSNIAAHMSPSFSVKEGDHVGIGQCRFTPVLSMRNLVGFDGIVNCTMLVLSLQSDVCCRAYALVGSRKEVRDDLTLWMRLEETDVVD
ncbi:hypothetical protein C4D60_Mb06t20280 [Musa balbisiana]|uniref:Uncharacterized protein n=1 Tax=Musa balbisiana TaxID=52838 RepID=A0A4S8IPD9_MUSBA|nr:hypothetical protein C4D60_Mb06t20280 [Musa balbisiana]